MLNLNLTGFDTKTINSLRQIMDYINNLEFQTIDDKIKSHISTSDLMNENTDNMVVGQKTLNSIINNINNKINLIESCLRRYNIVTNGNLISPTVTSNNLTVTFGNISVTLAAATNWFNSGSAELATKEIDYFVYLGYNVTDGVTIGFSRIPYANLYSDFSATTTNEKYCAISNIAHASSTDIYINIGRFAATLSAGAGYTWSVPTFTAINLIQRPCYDTRKLTWQPILTGLLSVGTYIGYYKINGELLSLYNNESNSSTSNANTFTMTVPWNPNVIGYATLSGDALDNGAWCLARCDLTAGTKTITLNKNTLGNASGWTNSGRKDVLVAGQYFI